MAKYRLTGRKHDGFVTGDIVELTDEQALAFRDKFVAIDSPEANTNDEGLRTDGPTFEEFVKAGYAADAYPPRGYVAKDSDDYTLYLLEKEEAENNAALAKAAELVAADAAAKAAIDAAADKKE